MTGWSGYRQIIVIAILTIATLGTGPLSSSIVAQETASQRRLLRVLLGRNEVVRLKTLYRLGTQREQLHDSVDVLIKAGRQLTQDLTGEESDHAHNVPESVVELIHLIGKTQTSAAKDFLIDSLDNEHPGVVMVAADAVGVNEVVEAIPALREQIKRDAFSDSYGFRFAIVRGVVRLHAPEAVALLEKLHDNLDGQLRHEITQRLDQVDIRDFPGEPDRLAAWQASRAETLAAAKEEVQPVGFFDDEHEFPLTMILQETASTSGKRMQLVSDQYYGIGLDAKRLLFVIDRSGSMKEPTRYGTRLQQAKTELIQTINGLSPDTEFAVLFFDTNVHPWRDDLLTATDENKREAITFIKRIVLGDKTNTHAALTRSLDFNDQLEAVFLLTDGKPTVGKTTNPNAIVADLVGRNRWRHLKFHTIGIGVAGPTQAFLQKVAKNSGGEFRAVD